MTQRGTNHSVTGNSFFSISATPCCTKPRLYYSSCCQEDGKMVENVGQMGSTGGRVVLFMATRSVTSKTRPSIYVKKRSLKSKTRFSPRAPRCPLCCSIYRHLCLFQNNPIRGKQRRRRDQSSEPRCTTSLNLVAANKCCSESGRGLWNLCISELCSICKFWLCVFFFGIY